MTLHSPLLLALFFVPAIVFAFAWFFWSGTAPGSYYRYVCKSIMYPTGPFAMAYFFMDFFSYKAEGDIFFMILSAYNFTWISIAVFNMYFRSDDDHWFKGRGKKIASSIKRSLTFTVPKLAPNHAS